MKPVAMALALFFVVACAGIGLISLSRSRIEAGQYGLLTIGLGLGGIAALGLAAVIYKGALRSSADQ